MSELSAKLTGRLMQAAEPDCHDRAEAWSIVAGTIELMIDKAVFEAERRLITGKPKGEQS